MVKIKVKKIIEFLIDRLREKNLNLSRIILFGSYAKGEANEDSDLDIVIVSKDFSNKDIFERVKLIKEPEILTIKKFMVPLDIITLTPEEFARETSILSDYIKNGVIVYTEPVSESV